MSYDPTEQYEQVTPATVIAAPDAPPAGHIDADVVEHGAYLVELLGCGTCHTDGALVGEPNYARRLAGSRVGVAYTNPLDDVWPGVVFAPNLTSDATTGLGNWSREEIAEAIRHGRDRTGRQQIPVMPWRSYANLSHNDMQAITAYLKVLPPVHHQVPEPVPAGVKTNERFVHFGVYQSRGAR
ncbi:MAG: c-type cytochrome [Pseudomonadota bacterium]